MRVRATGEQILINKIIGGIIGHAVGDALGVPVEFMARERLKANPITDMVGYGTYNQPPGTWSDDTSMLIATLVSINDCGYFNIKDIRNRFINWLYKGYYTPAGKAFDVGCTTRQALTNGRGLDDENSNGNGSLMRILPFAFFGRKSRNAIINEVSSITHAHERSKMACRIYCEIVNMLYHRKCDLATAINRAYEKEHDPEIIHFSRLPYLATLEESAIDSSGYVVSSLEAALWCALTTDNYTDCVLKAVNLGNDTDTIGAIAGGLAGVMYGISGIPEKWIKELQRSNFIWNTASMFARMADGY